jgi:hypothetical protein
MRYMLLINFDAGTPPLEARELRGLLDGHRRFEAELHASRTARLIHTERLGRYEDATRVRVKAGQRLITDGPFIETREVLGGFYLIECDTRNEAIEWTNKIPLREDRSIEVRPVRPR